MVCARDASCTSTESCGEATTKSSLIRHDFISSHTTEPVYRYLIKTRCKTRPAAALPPQTPAPNPTEPAEGSTAPPPRGAASRCRPHRPPRGGTSRVGSCRRAGAVWGRDRHRDQDWDRDGVLGLRGSGTAPRLRGGRPRSQPLRVGGAASGVGSRASLVTAGAGGRLSLSDRGAAVWRRGVVFFFGRR